MANIDVTTLGAIVITNVTEAHDGKEEVWNTGLEAVAGEAAVKAVDADFVPARDVEIPLYKSNAKVILAPGETLTLVPASNGEMIHFKGLAVDGVITVEDAEAETETEVEEG